jgi:hypothetical protein
MAIKTTGEEWKRFYSCAKFWENDATHEDESVKINGVLMDEGSVDFHGLNDNDVLEIDGGVVYINDKDVNLSTHFKRWQKEQKECTLIIKIDIINITKNFTVLAETKEEAKKIAREHLDILGSSDFELSASQTFNQSYELKSEAINYDS